MSGKFFLPAMALDQHIAILGKTGSGKTWAAKVIVEHVLRSHRQACIIDPTGAWWGLRLTADGKGRGLDVVLLGGEHADIPLAARSGAAVARLVTEQGANVVIDTSGFTVGEYTRWFIDFAGTLYTTLRNPLHLVIDEAHYFMPQGRVPDPDAGRMLHAGNRLMSGGRSRGVRGMLITQRPAKLHKDSLTCADTLIAMRVIAPQDRGAVKDWIDGMGDPAKGRAVLDSLALLKRGEGWVWYPEGNFLERTTFPAIMTYDSSAAPKHGEKATLAVGKIDLTEVKAALAEAVKEAEANDPAALRKRIAELERKLKEQKPTETKIVEVPSISDSQMAELKAIVGQMREYAADAMKTFQAFGSVGQAVQTAIDRIEGKRAETKPPLRLLPSRTPTQPFPQPSTNGHSDSTLPRGERAVLTAAAQHPSGVTREQLTVLTGYKRSSRDAYLQRLRERGYVRTGDRIEATDEGVAALGDGFEPLPTGEELRDYWLGRLPEGERKVLQILIDHYPDEVDRESLDVATGYKRSSRDAYLQRLSARELVETSRGTVRASVDLFDR